ncbi:hypothetical protein A9R01_18110 ['Osedax' symbiont bacterium Rs2_46_30_T18]|nr:hypothetical protein A9R01_18110 ['Osedax' symbiont bacterium Rs2_46_30_T18]
MPSTFDFEKIISSMEKTALLPPLDQWHPELSGDIDISIDRQGVWRHCGEEFSRREITVLFSRILCREGNDYFLKTPVEKWRIQVADVPFYFIHYQQTQSAKGTQLSFISSTEDVVVLDAEHPLRIQLNQQSGEPSPYLQVRGTMEGKLSRNLYYQLVELAQVDEQEQKLYLHSCGHKFCLGSY